MLLLLWIILQTKWGQNKALPIVLDQIEKALGAEVEASKINIDFFEELTLSDILIRDNEGDTLVYANSLNIDIRLFSFWDNILMIDDIGLSNAKINIKKSGSTTNYQHITDHLSKDKSTNSTDEKKEGWKLGLDDVILDNVDIVMSSEYEISTIGIHSLETDFNNFTSDFETIDLTLLSGDGISYSIQEIAKNPISSGPTNFPSLAAKLKVAKVDLRNTSFSILRLSENKTAIIDPNNLQFTNINLSANNFEWKDKILADIEELTFEERSGLKVAHLETALDLSDNELVLGELKLKTADSYIEGNIRSQYASFDQLISDLTNSEISVDIDKSTISRIDLQKLIDLDNLNSINLAAINDIKYTGILRSQSGVLDLSRSDINIDNKLIAKGAISIQTGSANIPFGVKLSKIETTESYLKKIFPSFRLSDQMRSLGSISGSIDASGDNKNMILQSVDLALGNGTLVKGSGTINRYDNIDKLWLDLEIDQLKGDVRKIFISDGSIPEQVLKLGEVDFSGSYQGNLKQINVDGSLDSDLGQADLDMESEFNSDYSNATYNGKFDLKAFELGQLLDDPKFGIITANGTINGSGLNLDDLKITTDVKGDRFDYDGKTYTDITINGSYEDSSFTGKVKSNDENLKLDFEGTANLDGENTLFQFESDLEKLDLTQFGIGDSSLWMSGVVKGNLKGNNIDNIIGAGEIDELKIGTRHGVYTSDKTISFLSSTKTQGTKEYKLDSEALTGTITGNINLSEIGAVLTAYIRDYIPIESGFEDQAFEQMISYDEDQSFIMDLRTKDINPLLDVMTGGDINMHKGKIGGYFSNYDAEADFKASFDTIKYKGYRVDNADIFFDGREDFINGDLLASGIYSGEDKLIEEAIITSSFNDNVADIQVELYDSQDEEVLFLGADLSRTSEYVLNFHDTIRINQDIWEFSEYNEINYGEYGLYMQDVKISREDQAITIYTDENDNGQAIEILFDNFILSYLATIIGKKNDNLEGEINGSVLINNIWDKPFATADLAFEDITISGGNIGTLSVEATQDTKTNTVSSLVALEGRANDAILKLDYGISNSELNGELDIRTMEMKVLDPILSEVIKDSKGSINGKVKIAGKVLKPSLTGKINLKSVETIPVFTNSRYRIEDTSIDITDTRFALGEVSILDDDDNKAILSGNIFHQNLSDVRLDFKVNSDKFQFLKTTSSENPLFYGDVKVRANVFINGPLENILIDGAAEVIDNSELALSPFSVDQIDYENDFIIYADPRSISLDSLNARQLEGSKKFPFDVDVKMTVAEDSKFTMIMDPVTGDKITGRGIADLIFQLKQTGEIELYGNYTVTSGDYFFTFGIINKTFDIQPNSRVVFNGNPLEGELDVSAIYETSAAVYDLIVLEIGEDFGDSKKVDAKRKRKINVVLNLSKSILKPEIKMDILIPEGDLQSSIADVVESKLNALRTDQDELNKQVFGLMIFDNFILASSAETDFAQTGADIAISSLSGLVTKQLNALTEGLIKGFELNFDVNSYSSDYISSGEGGLVTELGVDVSQKLFNDRLTISAGTNIDLESSTSESTFNNIAGDFVLTYNFEEDGSFTGKVFRKSNVDRLVEGDGTTFKNGGSLFIRKQFGSVKKKENK